MHLQLIRNATLRIGYAGQNLLTDPMLSPSYAIRSFAGKSENPTVDLPFPLEQILSDINAVLVSHVHPDHFDEAARTLLPKDIPVFCQPGDDQTLKDFGFQAVRNVQDRISWQGIDITRTDGLHGTGLWLERMGQVSGFVLQAPGEPTVYWVGDSIWCESVQKALDRFQPDLIITHSCGAGFPDSDPIIMDTEQTVALCRAAPKARVVAVHMEALDHATVTRAEFREAAEQAGISSDHLLIPQDGQECEMNAPHHIVAYCSPNGSTANLAAVIEQELTEHKAAVSTLNLGNPGWEERARELITPEANLFLWLGSPVYALHPVPPVEAFFSWLPDLTGRAFAIPFVTWGLVTSGIALWEMGRALEANGFQLAGAAAVPARHSSMWQSEQPLGAGRPDTKDKTELAGLVRRVLSALSKGAPSGISSEVLDYQPESVKKFAGEINIKKSKQNHPGYRFDQDLCIQCGICRDYCPAGAISLDPFPVRNDNCFVCNACARLCPEGAMSLDTSGMEKRLLGLQERFREEQTVRLFA